MKNKFYISFGKYIVLTIIILVILVPIIYILFMGFRTHEEALRIIPTRLTLENIPLAVTETYRIAKIAFSRMYLNNIFITLSSILGVLIVATLAGFGFSHYSFRFKEALFVAFLLSAMIPVHILLIPLFFLMKIFKLFDSYLVLILPYIAFQLPVSTLILRSFFERIPKEIEESAKIDGANDFRIFFNIVLPLARPALATVMTLSFLSIWNEFIFALVFIRHPNMQTITLVLNRMIGATFVKYWELYGAILFLTLIPILIVFIIFQRWFIAGLSEGGIKG